MQRGYFQYREADIVGYLLVADMLIARLNVSLSIVLINLLIKFASALSMVS